MTNPIPIVGPTEAKYLFRYFVSIDRLLAKRFTLSFDPDEEHLTSLLTELMDKNGATLHSLAYPIEKLNADLAESASLLRISLSLNTTKYNKYQESKFTQADIGVVLDYRDYVNYNLSFRKALLLQAKRLFRDNANKFTVRSAYDAYDKVQHDGLTEIEQNSRDYSYEHARGNRCYYLLYNPAMTQFELDDQERIKHQQQLSDATDIFDFTHGLHLYHEMLANPPIQSFADLAAIVTDVHAFQPEPGDAERLRFPKPKFSGVLDGRNIRKSSFPWFLVFDFLLGSAGDHSSEFVQFVTTGGTLPNDSDSEIEFFPPRYVLTIKAEAGTNPEQSTAG